MGVTINGGPVKKGQYMKHLESPAPEKTKASQVYGTVMVEKTTDSATGATIKHQTQVPVLSTPVIGDCKVVVGGGRKITDGNYGNFSVYVSLEVPCTKDSIGETFEFASDWVSTRLKEALDPTPTKGD